MVAIYCVLYKRSSIIKKVLNSYFWEMIRKDEKKRVNGSICEKNI